MLFNSLNFLIFMLIVVSLYYILPHKVRWVFLLFASLYFYMAWKVELIVLILFSTFANYLCAIFIDKYRQKAKMILTISLLINFGMLFVFKYLLLINQTVIYFFGQSALGNFNIILPMGISFYTFQAVGYTIDVYRDSVKPQRNYFKFTLFITFFPQLVAGPIERTENLMPQLFEKADFKLSNLLEGVKIISYGFFMKLVIADRASIIVNTVYNSPRFHGFLAYLIATILFAVQIYCDFAGYSEIAMGCAKMLGIDLMRNFRSPYFSKSVKEFWRRWHISLSGWFKDYVYIPLGGNRNGKKQEHLNLMITFLLSGLWHGANWTFLLFGALNGLYQVMGSLKDRLLKRPKNYKGNPFLNIFRTAATFTLIGVSWIFFRANTVEDAFYIINHFFRDFRNSSTPQGAYNALNALGANPMEMLILLVAILFLFIVDFLQKDSYIHDILNRQNFILRYAFYYFVFSAILLTGVFTSGSEFIYFQF